MYGSASARICAFRAAVTASRGMAEATEARLGSAGWHPATIVPEPAASKSAIRSARSTCVRGRVSPDWSIALAPAPVSFLLSFVDAPRDHSSALRACRGRGAVLRRRARGAARAQRRDLALHPLVAADQVAADRARDLRPVVRGQLPARMGIRALGVPRYIALESQPGRIARAPPLLRYLPRPRRRPRSLARGAAQGRFRVRPAPPQGLALQPLHAEHRTTPVQKPVAASRDLQLQDGARRDHRPLQVAGIETARCL